TAAGGHQRTESVVVASGPRGVQRTGARVVIATRRLQQHFADGLIAEAVEDLWEPWMHYADTALEDDALLLIIQEELAIHSGIVDDLAYQIVEGRHVFIG